MTNQRANRGVVRASGSAKYKALIQQHRSRVLSRTLQLTRLVHSEQGLVAFSLSGNATFAAKHLIDGRTDGFPKGHWLSQKAFADAFPGEQSVSWICPSSWWHFQEVTFLGSAADFERHYAAMKSAAAAITLDGDTPVTIQIKEQEHSITDDELQSLAAIWPGLRTEAA